MTVRAYAPASAGNLIAGFDVLGAALAPVDGSLWGDVVTVESGESQLTVTGPCADRLPPDPAENLVTRCAALFARELARRGRSIEPVALTLHKGLPLCSGLGSSASSVVATLVALNAFHGAPLEEDDLLALAGEGEGLVSGTAHLDNVGPSLRGGLQLVTSSGCRTLPFPADWRLAVVHPDILVPTAAARAALPDVLPLSAAVSYWQNLAALVHALHTDDRDLIAATLHDELAEPCRRQLVPGFAAAKAAALAAGAVACSLSGSGPSMLAVVPEGVDGAGVLSAMAAALSMHRLTARLCRLDMAGARCL